MSCSSTHQAPFDPYTLCAQAGTGRGDGNPLTTPIAQSTTFCRSGVDSDCEHQYSRVSNPTVAALESALGRLEDAPPGVCFGSGLAAETALFLSVLRAGDHVVCGASVYGGTTRLLRELLAPLGVEASFVDATRVDDIEQAVRPTTRLIFIETPANPTLELTDIRAVSEVARGAGALLCVDNTFLTPVLQRPLDLGADISVTSTTKFVEGHSAAIGGVVVSRDETLLERVRFVRKSTGAILSAQHAWITLQGLKTLALRLDRQCATATRIATWLAARPEISRVCYPGLGDASQKALAERQHLGAHGAVVSFELRGGVDAARSVAGSVRLCRVVEHVGSVETLLTHPATMTHADVPAEDRARVGITDGLLRLSVGLESFDAIICDLARAFEHAPEVSSTREEAPACHA